jgi:tRNA(Ile)-lysidine synthase
MQQEFLKYLNETCHCRPDRKYLLAVSGGVDSVVMTFLYHLSGIEFSIAHCNFHLRGEESEEDRNFVEQLARSYHRPFYLNDFDTKTYAEEQGVSIQMAARHLRYTWFNELAGKLACDYIATGHNRNDIVETVLLNLARGTGIRGLSGISPVHGKIIRPLLFASRESIAQFARENNLQWREDSSNAETKYHRNYIRHTIIPAFQKINPAFLKNAIETSGRLEHTERLLDWMVDLVKKEVWTELPDRCLIHIEKLKEYPSNDILLFELLREFGVSQLSIESILTAFGSNPGKQFLTRTHCITRDRSTLIITRRALREEAEVLIDQETVQINYPLHLTFTLSGITPDFTIPTERHFAALDADTISFPLLLRCWKEGDKFHPLGMEGSKKISDFLINNKIARPDKNRIWVLETGGRIAWVVNYRIDDRFRIKSETRKILLIAFKE